MPPGPSETIKVLVGTWNLGDAPPPSVDILQHWLQPDKVQEASLVVVGTQVRSPRSVPTIATLSSHNVARGLGSSSKRARRECAGVSVQAGHCGWGRVRVCGA
eukprot:2034493-Rhodomonas_salina.1